MENHKKPIGWYLKELDALITNQMNKTLGDLNVNRTQWQILKNTSDFGFINSNDFFEQLSRFVNKNELKTLIQELEARGLLKVDNAEIRLTTNGIEAFRQIQQIQQNNRDKIMQNIDPQNYDITLNTLELMVLNLQ